MEVYDDPLTLFRDALSNPVTRDRYERLLDNFFKFLEVKGESLQLRAEIFDKKSKNDPKWASSSIMKWIRYQKERAEKKEISTSSLGNYYKPIKLFCEMNDITLNWKKITRGIPKGKKHSTDRIPTLDEIKQLLSYPDRRLKPAVLVMMSSGIRLGAWDFLKWGEITPIEKNGKIVAAKIIVYRGEPEEYASFITPEAYNSLKEYIDFRISHHEIINEKSPVLRDEFDVAKSSRGLATVPKRLKSSGLKRLIERALWGQGLRKKLEDGKKRHEFKADHGFRKYFKTITERHLKSLHVEILMGHSLGLGDSYYRISDDELLAEYLKAVPDLSAYESPLAVSNDKFENLQKEFMQFKIDFAWLIQILKESKGIKIAEIDHRLSTLRNHINLVKEGVVVKDNDGTEYLV